jgi:hypothetical protein
MFKKIISVLLITCLSFSLCNVALMAEPSSETEVLEEDTTFAEVVKGNDIYSQKDYTIKTKYEGIKQSVDGYYAMTIETKNGIEAIPVGKLDIDLANDNDVKNAISNTNISPEIKERLEMRHKQIVDFGYKTVKATLFSSDLLPTKINSTSTDSTKATSSTTYYTYKGAQMKSDKLFYSGLNTDYQRVSSGSTAHTVADGIFDVILIVTSSNKYINFFATGISLFQAFCNMFGTWATGSTSDFVSVRLIYDNTDQWTYRKVNNQWLLGLCSQKAVVTNIASEQYYYNSAQQAGKTYSPERSVSVTHKSPHFDSPWATAYQWCYNPVDEWMKWRCGSVTFVF